VNAIQEALSWLGIVGRDALRRKTVRSLLIVIGVVVTGSGFILALVDPAIHSPLAGIWYSLVTLAHVGYGDIVATSFIGRVISAFLILFGIGLFALSAGIFASILVVHDLRGEPHEEGLLEEDHETAERKILLELKALNQKIQALESKLATPARRPSSK
jgi:voltage-gated potassium channel